MIGIFLGLRDIFNNGGRKFVLKKICEKNYTFMKVDFFWQTDESNIPLRSSRTMQNLSMRVKVKSDS